MHIIGSNFVGGSSLWVDVYFTRGDVEYEATVIYHIEDWEEGEAYLPYYSKTQCMSEVDCPGEPDYWEEASLNDEEIEILTEKIYSSLNAHSSGGIISD